MSSEARGCTASNHGPKAIQCCCSVKLMLFFQAFCCQWHSRKVFQEGFVPLYCKPCEPRVRGHVPLQCRPCATTPSDLVLLFCMLRAAKLHTLSYKSACPVLQSLCRLTVGPLPPRCRYCAALLLSLSATLQALCRSTAGPVLLQRLPVAVTMQAP